VQPIHTGSQRAVDVARRFGTELRVARVAAGLTQRRLAQRSGISQQEVSRAERGDPGISLAARCRLAAGTGHELVLRLYPTGSVSLRDSGQLQVAEVIVAALHPSWTARMEAPVAAGDLRAADVLLSRSDELVEIEIERSLVDLQAQLRAAQVKRRMLSEGSVRPVRLVLAVPDSTAMRARIGAYPSLLSAALPVRSRQIAAAIRNGHAVGGDGILFVRIGRLTSTTSTR
jgi:transcriptional regulator with XRE-family HTH domain